MEKNMLEKKEMKINKKIFEILGFIIYGLAMIVFEVGYCNGSNVINTLNGNYAEVQYNFSLCRVVIYAVFLIILYFAKNKFSIEAEKTSEKKLKRIIIYSYLILSIITIIIAIGIILNNPLLIKGMSIGIITVLMGAILIMYVSNDIYKNIIIIIFSIGIIFTFTTKFNHALDEKRHFMSAFNVSFGNFDYSENPITDPEIEKLPQTVKFIGIDEFLSEKYQPNITDEVNKDDAPSTPTGENPIIYLMPALGIFIARTLGGSIIDLYIMGRVFNLIQYSILIIIALKLIPYKKNIFAVIFLMPMALVLAGSYSADGYCIGIVAILIAYCLKLKKECQVLKFKEILILSVIFVLTLLAKSMAYVLIGIIFLMLPIKNTLKANKKYIPIISIIAVIGILVVALLAWHVKETKITSDSRGTGSINVEAQLNNLITNPIFDIKLIIAHIKNTFLNFQWDCMLHYEVFFTSNAQCVFIPLILFILYVALTEDDYNFKIKDKIIMLISFFLIYLMTSMVLYLSFTQVGVLYIAGYQTRYILPILSLVLFCLSNNRLKTQNKENRNLNIAIASSIFIVLGIAQSIIV